MNEQQQHLESALNQQKELIAEIQELNNTLTIKKEQFLKLQGIVEYLNSLGTSDSQESDGVEKIEINDKTIE